jgi:hypothetical protein
MLVVVCGTVASSMSVIGGYAGPASTTTSGGGQNIATPVVPLFYVNGQKVTGTLCFSAPSSSVAWSVTADYPYKVPDASGYPPPIRVAYSFAPFPLSGTLPAWLHLSMRPESVALSGGQNSTAILLMTLDPSVRNGDTAYFALHASFTDPLSGSQVLFVIVLGFVVNGTSSDISGCAQSAA